MEIKIYLEGGGDSKEQRARCREGLSKLMQKAGFTGRLPSTDACGGRSNTFRDFQISLENKNRISLLLVDSEDPIVDLTDEVDNDFGWRHLKTRDGWERPKNTSNYQVILMATCMESWIAADREALKEYYGTAYLQENALPPLFDLENRHRHTVQEALLKATKTSKKFYKKGERSFDILASVDPNTLSKHLSQFRRFIEVLKKVLQSR